MNSPLVRRLSKHSPAVVSLHHGDVNDETREIMNVEFCNTNNGSGLEDGCGDDGNANNHHPPNDKNNSHSGETMSGIDSFLYRLYNDADLNNRVSNRDNSTTRIKKKMKRQQQQQQLLDQSSSYSKTSIRNEDSTEEDPSLTIHYSSGPPSKSLVHSSGRNHKKRIALSLLFSPLIYLIYDTMISPPHQRFLHRYFHLFSTSSTTTTTTTSSILHRFLSWVQLHPTFGAIAFIFAYGLCVILLLPGTPLTLGGGYVYKVSYGWMGGLVMATFTTIAGSLFGSCTCFLLGRYILRSRVRIWGRKKYPFFDAMDGAISENGFKIMCLLYLTPILPLGPVSYMVGTTSMSIAKFAGAKIAAVPIVMMYCFIGASTDTFFGNGDDDNNHNNMVSGNAMIDEKDESGSIIFEEMGAVHREGIGLLGIRSAVENGTVNAIASVNEMLGGSRSIDSSTKVVAAAATTTGGVDESTHRKMVLFGLILSFVSMSLVSHFVKKELYKIFDKQKRDKSDGDSNYDTIGGRRGTIQSSSISTMNASMEDHNIEMGSGVDRKTLLRRPRGGGVVVHQDGIMEE